MLKVVALAGALVIGGTVAAAVALAGGDGLTPELAQVRAATAKYHSVTKANRDGYVGENEPCVASPLGGMGYHYVNGPLIGDPTLDPKRPEILVYAPSADGGRRLVAIEYFAVAADQDPSDGLDDADRPTLFGVPFDGPMAGHAPGMPYHYDLHVWLFKRNPSGLFAMWNPKVGC